MDREWTKAQAQTQIQKGKPKTRGGIGAASLYAAPPTFGGDGGGGISEGTPLAGGGFFASSA